MRSATTLWGFTVSFVMATAKVGGQQPAAGATPQPWKDAFESVRGPGLGTPANESELFKLAACPLPSGAPDSLFLTGGVDALDLYIHLRNYAVWRPILIPQSRDTLKADVIAAECETGGPALVLKAGSFVLRLLDPGVTLYDSVARRPGVFVRGTKGGLDPAIWDQERRTYASFPRYLDSMRLRRIRLEREDAEEAATRRRAERNRASASRAAAERRLAERRKQIEARGWPRDVTDLVVARRFRIGFTKSQLVAAIGSPRNINRTVTQYGVREQWVYGSLYVYLDDGIVTAFQDHQ